MKKILILILSYIYLLSNSILTPNEAFKPSAKIENDKIITNIELGKDIYLYADKLKFFITKPKEMEITQFLQLPKSEPYDDYFVYKTNPKVDIPLSLIKQKIENAKEFTLKIKYQGCSSKGLCYQPLQVSYDFKMPNNISLDKTQNTNNSLSQEQEIVNMFKDRSFLAVLGIFFLFGLFLSFTPCVFPMIPILSSIIVAKSDENMSAKKGFLLSLVYVLSMALAYAIAGVIAGLFGANLQTALQNPWAIGAFSAIFVALALSMFGYFEIKIPSFIQTKIDKKIQNVKGGGYAGVAIMGFLSALIVGPCIAPPLAGALIYISQSGDALLGGLALFVMSLGMGALLLIVGAGAGKFVPKPGNWMSRVSQVFGVIMLAIAIWMLSRVIPAEITMFLWALLFIGSAVYMGAFEPFDKNMKGALKLIKVFAIILFLYGALLFIGAFLGGQNPLDPLEKFKSNTATLKIKSDKLNFKIVPTLEQLKQEIKDSDKFVMVDFYADWCISCKELELYTFSDPRVKEILKDFKLLKIDVTKNTKEDKKILKEYNLFGPPAIIFYDKEANEIKSARVIGFKSADEFIEILKTIK